MSHHHDSGSSKAIIGMGLVAAAGAATFLLARRTAPYAGKGSGISDAPDHVWRSSSDRGSASLVGRTVTIGRPREELYRTWKDFTRFPAFMENVERIEDLGGGRSSWTIKAPLGRSVTLATQITDDRPGRAIAWRSEPESDIRNLGRVEFLDAPPGRGTIVRLTMQYDPPGGLIGQGLAKLFQREPSLQARRDLRRFKQLMETGEVTTNASPSGRASESPAKPHV